MRNFTIKLLVYNAVIALTTSEDNQIKLSLEEMEKSTKFVEVVDKIASDPIMSQIIEPRGDYSLKNQVIHTKYSSDIEEIVNSIANKVHNTQLENEEDKFNG